MKKTTTLALMALILGIGTSCKNDENKIQEPTIDPIQTYHFDIWASTDGTTGMAGNNDSQGRYVQSVGDLSQENTSISFEGVGADLESFGLNDEIMMHGKYYYQVAPAGRGEVGFGKYVISSTSVDAVYERPFSAKTYASTKYCTDWINDTEFVVISSADGNKKIQWSKIKDEGEKLSIVAEGDFDLSSTHIDQYSTSGLVRYRKSDNTLIYLFCDYSRAKIKTNKVFAAFIDPATMAIKSIAEIAAENRALQLAGTVYGELAQQKLFFDESDNLYIACSTQIPGTSSTTCAYSSIYCIKAGTTQFDSYESPVKPAGFTGDANYYGSKVVTVDYLGNQKVLLYLQDPQYCNVPFTDTEKTTYLGWNWTSSYNCYYGILDLNTKAVAPVQYHGVNIPNCKGTFSQRSVVIDGKAYIGTNPEQGNPTIYVMDLKSGNITKGASIPAGYEFNRITVMQN